MSENILPEPSLRTAKPQDCQVQQPHWLRGKYLFTAAEWESFPRFKKNNPKPQGQGNRVYRALSPALPTPQHRAGEGGPGHRCGLPRCCPPAGPGDVARAVLPSRGGRGAPARAVAQGTRCAAAVTLWTDHTKRKLLTDREAGQRAAEQENRESGWGKSKQDSKSSSFLQSSLIIPLNAADSTHNM